MAAMQPRGLPAGTSSLARIRINQAAGVSSQGRLIVADSTGLVGASAPIASPAMRTADLTTPALVVEAPRLEENLQIMTAALPGSGSGPT